MTVVQLLQKVQAGRLSVQQAIFDRTGGFKLCDFELECSWSHRTQNAEHKAHNVNV